MEINYRNLRRASLATASAIALSGCGTIHENKEVSACGIPDGVYVEATNDPSQKGYSTAKDPAILAAKLEQEANKTLEQGDDSTWHNIIVGIGEITCTGANEKIYLTPKGTELSLRSRD